MAHNSQLISARSWEVFSPPPLNSFRGSVIPKALTKRRRRRKVSIEVHKIRVEQKLTDGGPPFSAPSPTGRVVVNNGQNGEDRTYEECIIRVLDPDKRLSNTSTDDGNLDDESSTAESMSPEYRGQGNYTTADYRGWTLKWSFPVSAMAVKGGHRSDVIVQIKLGDAKTQLRELIFDSPSEADDFRRELELQLGREEIRKEMRFQAQLGDQLLIGDEKITFLIEIVSGWNLPAGDVTSSDPFVKCSFNGRIIHETKYISKTRDPIWTLKTGALFLWTVNTTTLFQSDGLQCFVWDFDKIGANELLGWVSVPPQTLFSAHGERLEFKLQPPPGSNVEEVSGYLAIRCRRASDYDKRFMQEYADSESSQFDPLSFKNITRLATESAGGSGNIMSMIRQNKRIVREHKKTIKQYRIRPGPDPKRVDETTWMTKEAIEEECNRDSFSWVDSGSGRIGRLFLEILRCDDLPNLDTGGIVGNKTDAFVSIVYEDTVVTTDIVDDCLAPRWMPWTKRAFIFHIHHSSSQIFLGVFDYDVSMNPADDHDLVGRVTVDLSNLRRDTVYNLTYNIYTTARVSARKAKGTISIRLRLDISDERQLLLASLEPPVPMYVNSKRRRDFRVVRFTCTGKVDTETYSMNVINSYIEELLALQHSLFYMQDASVALLLWRGTSPLTIGKRTVKLPVHSFTAFVLAVLLVERPELLPSFVLFGVAWVLLATMDYRRQLPDLWSRCKSYSELLSALVLGTSGSPPGAIEPLENEDEAKRLVEAWRARIAEAEEAAAKSYQNSVRLQEDYASELEEIGEMDTDISTKQGGLSIDPFKPLLFPVQQSLALICRYIRHVKYVLLWEECYVSFWVVTGCLLLGITFLFVPWFFLIKWSARAIVWTFFGPWMKLVDIYYVRKMVPATEDELESRNQIERERRHRVSSAAAMEARIKREEAVKMKAMKKFIFGKYITRVPILKEDRYRDMPLPQSSAIPYSARRLPLSELAMQEAGYHRTRLPGQRLVGDMIPKVQAYGFTEAPIGQATAHPRLLDSRSPGGGNHSDGDSDVAAYAKIGSIVVSAAIITWFGVPILAAVTEHFLHWIF